jgi:hypothetical protein
MKKSMLILIAVWVATVVVKAQTASFEAQNRKSIDLKETLMGLFSENDVFSPKSNFAWVNFQLFSNRGKRPDFEKPVIPMFSLNYERAIWMGLGIRGSLSSHWWKEDKVLAASATEKFKEIFTYRYFVLGTGVSWHFKVTEKWDPFVGYLISTRWLNTTCDCSTDNKFLVSHDLYMGTRYYWLPRFFLIGEVGQHENGYLKLGFGLKL